MSHKNIHICEVCNKSFTTYWSMIRHQTTKHKAPQPKTYEEYLEEKTTKELNINNLELRVECLENENEILKQQVEEHKEKISELIDTIVSIRLSIKENIKRFVMDYLKND